MNALGGLVVPSAERYKEALVAIEPRMTKAQRAMLAFHYRAQNRAATFTQLAAAIGYDDYRLAKLHYVNLAERLGREVGLNFETHTFSGGQPSCLFRSAIGSGSLLPDDTGHFQLVMHPELATALDQLGWFLD
jgi:hypothetical protein